MATSRCQPPPFAGSGSGSAHTASSKSRASSPSMVTSGTCRRSSRCPSGAGPASAAIASAASGKTRRDVVVVDGDQADGAGSARRAAALDDPGAAQAQRLALVNLGPNQLPRLGAHGLGDLELLLGAAIHRQQPAAAADELEDPQRAHRSGVEPADDPRLVAAGRILGEPGQHPVAANQRGAAAALGDHVDPGRRHLFRPGRGLGRHLAVDIDVEDLQHRHGRQLAGAAEPPAVAAVDGAVVLELPQDLPELDLLLRGEAEGAGELALADAPRARLDVFQHLLAARQRRCGSFGWLGHGGCAPGCASPAACGAAILLTADSGTRRWHQPGVRGALCGLCASACGIHQNLSPFCRLMIAARVNRSASRRPGQAPDPYELVRTGHQPPLPGPD